MKRRAITCFLALALLAPLLAGCGPTLRIPALRPPTLANEQEELSRASERNLPKGAQLSSAQWPANSGSYISADVDADGGDETLVIFRDSAAVRTGVLVLKHSDGAWRTYATITEQGREIERIIVADVTGDHRPEILIGWSSSFLYKLPNGMDIYEYGAEGAYRAIGSVTYDEIAVADVNGDGVAELITQTRGADADYVSSVSVFSYATRSATYIATAFVDGYPLAVTVGAATRDRIGIFVDTSVGAHSSRTQLYLLEGNTLRPVFPDDPEHMIVNPYSLVSTDANGDGIIEVGLLTAPVGADDLSMAETPWIENWHQWNGGSGLTPTVLERYSDYNSGFQFVIPDAWKGKFTLTRLSDDDGQAVTFEYIGPNRQLRVPLLTIRPIDRTAWATEEAALREARASYFVFATGNGRIYVGITSVGGLVPTDLAHEYGALRLSKDALLPYLTVLTR